MSSNDETVLVNVEEETQLKTASKTEDQSGYGSLERAYMELGKAFYEGRYEDPTPELLPYFDRITRLIGQTSHEVKMDETEVGAPDPIQTKIEDEIDAYFEAQRPKKLEDLSKIADPIVPSMPVAQFCPECGTKHDPEDLFCGNCGFRLR